MTSRAYPPHVGADRPAGSRLRACPHAWPRDPSHVNDDWTELLAALAGAGARYLVVGAHALAVHGVPRGTQGLNVWIDPADDNIERVWRGLAAFGAPLDELGVTREDLRRPGTVVQLGLPPNRIDLLTSITGVAEFESAWQDRVEQAFGGRRVPFIGRAALIRNNRGTGRRKDLADLGAATVSLKRHTPCAACPDGGLSRVDERFFTSPSSSPPLRACILCPPMARARRRAC